MVNFQGKQLVFNFAFFFNKNQFLNGKICSREKILFKRGVFERVDHMFEGLRKQTGSHKTVSLGLKGKNNRSIFTRLK